MPKGSEDKLALDKTMNNKIKTQPGQSFPLGATVHPDGVHFCVFSKNSTAMELLLFDDVDTPQTTRVIPLRV